MKTNQLLLLFIVFFLGATKNSYSQCSSCADSSNIISYNGNGVFSTLNAQAYYWSICEGNAVINGSNTNQTVNVSCTSSGTFKIKVTRFINGTCIEACEIYNCNNGIIVIGNACNYSLGILDEYLDGTQSGSNIVYLQASGNFPNGTSYSWTITRQDGSTQFYSASTQNPRMVSASINNRITKATVTATYQNCTKTVTKIFRCAIPNADINGELFPECSLFGGGIGFSKISEKIKVYPNPTKANLSFEGKDLENYKITIFDFMGNIIIKDSKLNEEINLDSEKSGIYFYIISDDQMNIQEGKIIKE